MKTFLKNSTQLLVYGLLCFVIATVGFLAGQDITRHKMEIDAEEFSQNRANTVFRLKAEMTPHIEVLLQLVEELE